MKKILSFLIILGYYITSYSQVTDPCTVTPFANPQTVFCGDSVNLSAIGSNSVTVFENDFNGCNIGTGWESTQQARFDDPCGVSVDGSCYLWFGNTSPAPRQATTAPIDLSTGGTIEFTMRYAVQADASPCEGVDLPDEGVSVEYSIAGGPWNTIQYYAPNGGRDPQRTNWNRYTVTIPAAAMQPNTRIRWVQKASSNANSDHWGLEDVKISINDADYEWMWGHIGAWQPTPETPPVFPFLNTTYTIVLSNENNVSDPSLIDRCEAEIDVTVVNFTGTATANPTSVCPGDQSVLDVTINEVDPLPSSCGEDPGKSCNPVTRQAGEISIGNGNLVSGNNSIEPEVFGDFGDAHVRNQIIYRAAELQAAGLQAGSKITNIQFDVATIEGNPNIPNFIIKMGCTNQAAFNGNNFINGLTQVYGNVPHTAVNGLNTFFLDSWWIWDGTSNIVIEICAYVPDGNSANDADWSTHTRDHTPGFNAWQQAGTNFSDANCILTSFQREYNRRPNTIFGTCDPRDLTLVYDWQPQADLDDNTLKSPTATVPGTTTYTVTFHADGIPQCAVNTTVTVDAESPIATPIVTQTGPYCVGETIDLTITNPEAGATYNWTGPGGYTANGTSISRINADIPMAGTYTVQGINPPGCPSAITTIEVDVVSEPAAPTANDVQYCQNEATTPLTAVGTGSFLTWYDVPVGGTDLGGAPTPSSATVGNPAQTFYVADNIGTCEGPRTPVNVIIDPLPTLSQITTENPICPLDQAIIDFSSDVPNSTIDWTQTQDAGISGASDGSGFQINQNLDNINQTAGNVTYTAVATGPLPTQCVGPQFDVVVTVNPKPIAIADNTTPSICSGDEVLINLSSAVPNTVFTWAIPPDGDTTGASNNPNNPDVIIQEVLTNGGLNSVILEYEITPIGPLPTECTGDPITEDVEIIELDIPEFEYETSTYCKTGDDPTPNKADPNQDGIFTSDPGLAINASTGRINLGNSDIGTYTVTFTTTGPCPQVAVTQVTVTNEPDATFTYAKDDYCQNEDDPVAIFPSGASAGNITSNPSGVLFFPSDPGKIDLDRTPAGIYVITNTIPAGGGCALEQATFRIRIREQAIVNAGNDPETCQDDEIALSASLTGSATSATWSAPDGGTFSNTTDLNSTFNHASQAVQDGEVTIYITTNDPDGPCPAGMDSLIVTVYERPIVDAGSDFSICAGYPINLNGTQGGSTFSVRWTSSGTGNFPDRTLINPLYNPSQFDQSVPSITFTIESNNPPNICPAVSDQVIATIIPTDDAVFSYPTNEFCISGGNGIATKNSPNVPGVFYSEPANGIVINQNTGEINVPASNLGDYRIFFRTTDACPDTSFFDISILDKPNPEFEYDDVYCVSNATASPVFPTNGTTGTFTANPAGMVFNNNQTGVIDLNQSAFGTYTVTNTIFATAGCPEEQFNFVVRINEPASVDAGMDLDVCSDTSIQLAGSIGGSANQINWTTSGNGVFNDNSALNAVYTPSSTDSALGTVTLRAFTDDPDGPEPCPVVQDELELTIFPNHNLDAGEDFFICADETILLDEATFSGGTPGVIWTSTGDGFFDDSNLINPEYTTGSNDTANLGVQFIVTTEPSLSGPCPVVSDTINVEIFRLDNSNFNYALDTFCSNFTPFPEAIQVIDTIIGNYTAQNGGVIDNARTGEFNLAASGPGTYNVIFNTSGVCPTSTAKTITVVSPPDPTFDYLPEYCVNLEDPLPVFADGAEAGFFTANPANLIFVDPTTGELDLSLSAPIQYTVTNTIAASPGCPEMRATDIVTLRPLPVVNAGNDRTVCVDDTIQLLGQSEGVIFWEPIYNMSNGFILNPLVSPDTSVTYRLVAENEFGCFNSDELFVRADPLPPANAGPDQAICIFNETSLNASGGIGYFWEPDYNISNTGDPFANINPEMTTEYSLTVVDNNNCVNYDTVLITVNPLPIIDAGEDRSILNGASVQLTATGGISYEWSPNEKINGVNASRPIVYPTIDQEYTVIGTDENGCKNSDTIFIEVNGINIPTSFSPNGDGVNDIWMPIEQNNTEVVRIIIFNRWGNVVFRTEGSDPWNGQNIETGELERMGAFMYQVDYKDPEGNILTTVGNLTLIK